MEEFQAGSYCGLYCGACEIMKLRKKELRTGVKPAWDELPPPMQKHLPVPHDSPLVCHGCMSDTVFAGCTKCPIRACAKEQKNIRSCSECAKYPCMKLRMIRLMGKLLLFDRRLPHWKFASSNMKTICAHGVDYWLEEQKRFWTCQSCGNELSWYEKESHICGKTEATPIPQF